MPRLRRLARRRCGPALLLAIGFVAAPAAFATSAARDAGRRRRRGCSRIEADVGLALARAAVPLERRRRARCGRGGHGLGASAPRCCCCSARSSAPSPATSRSQPMMAAARRGEGRWSFAALHGVSAGVLRAQVAARASRWRGGQRAAAARRADAQPAALLLDAGRALRARASVAARRRAACCRAP